MSSIEHREPVAGSDLTEEKRRRVRLSAKEALAAAGKKHGPIALPGRWAQPRRAMVLLDDVAFEKICADLPEFGGRNPDEKRARTRELYSTENDCRARRVAYCCAILPGLRGKKRKLATLRADLLASLPCSGRCDGPYCPECVADRARRHLHAVARAMRRMRHRLHVVLKVFSPGLDVIAHRLRIVALNACFTQMRHWKAMDVVAGGVRVLELDWKSRGFLIHLHIVLDVESLAVEAIEGEIHRRISKEVCLTSDGPVRDRDKIIAYLAKGHADGDAVDPLCAKASRWAALHSVHRISAFGSAANPRRRETEACTGSDGLELPEV